MTVAVAPDVSSPAEAAIRNEAAQSTTEQKGTSVSAAPAVVVQKKSRKSKPTLTLEDCSEGTRTAFSWAEWLKKHGLSIPERTITLHKELVRLTVCVYRQADGKAKCGVLKIDDSLPKTILHCGVVVQKGESRIREFREWNEDLGTIMAKLLAKGWMPQALA